MKRFFRSLFRFTLCVVIFLAIYNIWLKLKADKTGTLREETRILALGDSHLMCGLIDDDFEMFENRCRGREPYLLNFFKLKYIIENNDINNLDAICLTHNFFSLNRYMDNIFIEEDIFVDKYAPFMLYYIDILSRYVRSVNKKKIFIKSRMPNMGHWQSSYLKAWMGGYKRSLESHIAPFSDLLDRKMGDLYHYGDYNDDLDSYVSSIQIDILKEIIVYTKELNIPLFLINAPQHKDYNDAVPEELKAFHSKLARELCRDYGTIYLDYHNMELPDSCFLDYDHLNTNGARIFTPILLEDIENYLSRY